MQIHSQASCVYDFIEGRKYKKEKPTMTECQNTAKSLSTWGFWQLGSQVYKDEGTGGILVRGCLMKACISSCAQIRKGNDRKKRSCSILIMLVRFQQSPQYKRAY